MTKADLSGRPVVPAGGEGSAASESSSEAPAPELRVSIPIAEHWRLHKEIERLTLADKQWADHVKRLADEVERLRTWAEAEQAERYKAEDQRTDERSDNERLRAFVGRVVGAYAVDEWIAEEGQRLLDRSKGLV